MSERVYIPGNYREYEQTEKESQTPLGFILTNDASHVSHAVEKYNPYTKRYEYQGEKEDPIQIFSDHHKIDGKWIRHLITIKQCRCCERPIEPYSESYYEKHRDNLGDWQSRLYSMRNSYCKECAIELSRKVTESPRLPKATIDKEREYWGNGEMLRTVVYEDGSTLEELSSDEISKDPCLRGN